MVVFVDLESEDDDPYRHSLPHRGKSIPHHTHRLSQVCSLEHPDEWQIGFGKSEDGDFSGRLFASALACYPVSLAITASLDLNDLYALSVTCRRVHESLVQFARQLRTKSLCCINDVPSRTSEEEVDAIIFQEAVTGLIEAISPETGMPAFPMPFNSDVGHLHIGFDSTLGLRGKVAQCARDMVAPCRKCGTIVCRNCTVKPPSDRNLPNRHRRLCRTCLDASLIDHLRQLDKGSDVHDTPPASSASSARSVRSSSSASSKGESENSPEHRVSFTFPAFLRQPCNCSTRGVYLCQPCGSSLNPADTTYQRVWTWRSRYSTHIGGGLGTGLGLGNQGQKCGRGEYCLERGAAGVCWVEIECSEARTQTPRRQDGFGSSRSNTHLFGEQESDAFIINKPGYLSQELEGIGGVLKKKVKKKVKVGATVYEYDDERASGKYLQRESTGKQRSWCGWCSRVCPDEKDKAEINHLLRSAGSHVASQSQAEIIS